jgi:DNA repair exonuclease SbcCD nuclease subunit
MKTLIHCADLHLAADEQDYSFKVLAELLQLTKKKAADFLLFAGDVFNSYQDADRLRTLWGIVSS